jgi:hypothetical protein
VYHASAAIVAVVPPEAVRKAAEAASALRGFSAKESVCLLDLRERIADLEKEHMVTLSFKKLYIDSRTTFSAGLKTSLDLCRLDYIDERGTRARGSTFRRARPTR